MSKSKGHTDLNTGNKFVDFARKRGAVVKKSGNFTSIETPKGKVHINASNDTLDKQTVSNLKKWFRLLGLMLFITICGILPIVRYIQFGR